MTALLSGSDAFDAAFTTDHGDSCVAVADDGSVRRFPVDRWVAEADATDLELFVRPCAGPTIDIGCGPGRLTAALVARGLIAFGIDVSTAAVLHARRRGVRRPDSSTCSTVCRHRGDGSTHCSLTATSASEGTPSGYCGACGT